MAIEEQYALNLDAVTVPILRKASWETIPLDINALVLVPLADKLASIEEDILTLATWLVIILILAIKSVLPDTISQASKSPFDKVSDPVKSWNSPVPVGDTVRALETVPFILGAIVFPVAEACWTFVTKLSNIVSA